MSKKYFWEFGNWDDTDAERFLGLGEEHFHNHPEDIRRMCWLIGNRVEALLANDAYIAAVNWNDPTTDLARFIYAFDIDDPRQEQYRNRPWWIPQTRLAQDFLYQNSYGGGTVWYEEKYGPYNIVEIDLENQSISISGNYYETNNAGTNPREFRRDSPFTITGSTYNNGFYRVNNVEFDGVNTVIELRAGNLSPGTQHSLIGFGDLGSVKCDFGGDYYCTAKSSTFRDCKFYSDQNEIFSANGDDIRPPAGGPMSWDTQGKWIRTFVPWYYHHYDKNAHRFYVDHAITDLGLIYPWITESHRFLPQQIDPSEQEVPVKYLNTSRVAWNLEGDKNAELTAEHVTIKNDMGAIAAIEEDRNYSVAGAGYDNRHLAVEQYLPHDMVDAFGYSVTRLQPEPEVEEGAEYMSPKMAKLLKDFACYQAMVEYYISKEYWSWPTNSDYESNWLDHYKLYTDPMSGTSEKYWETRNWNPERIGHEVNAWEDQPSIAYMRDSHWGENGSTFELALSLHGEYDWFYDHENPYYGDLLYAREKYGENSAPLFVPPPPGGLTRYERDDTPVQVDNVNDYVDKTYPLPIGTWRKTWRHSFGYKNRHMLKAHESSDPINQDAGDGSSGTAVYDGSTLNLVASEFAGIYRYSHPDRSEFRNFNFEILRIEDEHTFVVSGDHKTDDRWVDGKEFGVGGYVQFYGDDDEVVNCLGNFGIVAVEVIEGDTDTEGDDETWVTVSQDISSFDGVDVQGDTRIMQRHDPIFIDASGNEYYADNIEMWQDMRDIFNYIKYRSAAVNVTTLNTGLGIQYYIEFDHYDTYGVSKYGDVGVLASNLAILRSFLLDDLAGDPPYHSLGTGGQCVLTGEWNESAQYSQISIPLWKISRSGSVRFEREYYERKSNNIILAVTASYSGSSNIEYNGDYVQAISVAAFGQTFTPERYEDSGNYKWHTVYGWITTNVDDVIDIRQDGLGDFHVAVFNDFVPIQHPSSTVIYGREYNTLLEIRTLNFGGNSIIEFNWDSYNEECWVRDITRSIIEMIDPETDVEPPVPNRPLWNSLPAIDYSNMPSSWPKNHNVLEIDEDSDGVFFTIERSFYGTTFNFDDVVGHKVYFSCDLTDQWFNTYNEFLSKNIEGHDNLTGIYTVTDYEYIGLNDSLVKVYVEEDFDVFELDTDQFPIEFEFPLSKVGILYFGSVRVNLKAICSLCEDLELSDPVEYQWSLDFSDTGYSDIDVDWSTSRALNYNLGTELDIIGLFPSSNIGITVVAKDSKGNETDPSSSQAVPVGSFFSPYNMGFERYTYQEDDYEGVDELDIESWDDGPSDVWDRRLHLRIFKIHGFSDVEPLVYYIKHKYYSEFDYGPLTTRDFLLYWEASDYPSNAQPDTYGGFSIRVGDQDGNLSGWTRYFTGRHQFSDIVI